MNAITERFVRSIRNEALNNFIIPNKRQILKIITDYIEYYNSIPKSKPPDLSMCSHYLRGPVTSRPALGSLHQYYFYRNAA